MIFNFKKFSQILLASALIGSQIILLSAYEAHVINVTARICTYVETRTIGFWKNHVDIYIEYLPLYLGNEEVTGVPQVDGLLVEGLLLAEDVFENANAKEMIDMLKAQLLGMKFNVKYFVGTGIFEYDGTAIEDVIDSADEALEHPELYSREQLEYIKNLLVYLNEQHKLTHCSESDSGLTLFGNDEGYVAQLITSINSIEIIIEPATNCTPETKQQCDTGFLGVCATGAQWCDQYGFWDECWQVIASTTEICDNGLDDNCNGVTDCDDEICFEDLVCQVEIIQGLEVIPEPVCGDGNLDEGEDCDDGNTEDGDGCSASCLIEQEPEPYCGDGIVNGEDQCDNGENNGVECTPGYPLNCIYCSAECVTAEVQGAFCGDNILDELYEDCDDGNTEDGDGCSNTCLIEEPPEPECTDVDQDGYSIEGGDCGLVDCDDANLDVNPGAREVCYNQIDDDCDYLIDCNDTSCVDNLSCQPEPVCGDGSLDEGEDCDDGNTEDGDGCSAECLIEQSES